MTSDPIDNPSHYTEGRVFEPLSVIIDWDLDYLKGSALKYIARAGRKGDEIEDLEKAIRYLRKRIAILEGIRKIEHARDTDERLLPCHRCRRSP